MKIFFVVINVIFGLLVGFYGVNNLSYLTRLATQDTANQYYYGMTLLQGFSGAILWTIVGVFSVVSALAFKKDKPWAALALPLPPLVLFLYISYTLVSSTKSDLAWTGGIMTVVAFALLLFLILEILYLLLRRKTQATVGSSTI